MSTEKYDLLVFIGRFQPFHLGHQRVVELALKQAKHVLILVGSSYQARTIKNPFTLAERQEMILQNLEPQQMADVTIRGLRDHPYNDAKWMAEVQNHVKVLMSSSAARSSHERIGVIGYEKDDSSWYLRAFPQWDYIDVGRNYEHTIDATSIRTMWLTGQSPAFTEGVLRDTVHNFIYKKFPKKEFERLQREQVVITQVKKDKSVYKYPIIDQTVDSVVVQSGHVLLVKRRSAPGEGLWAIPGGYLNANETVVTGMLRELREETKLRVPEPVLRGSIKSNHRFDAVERSLRGRIITDAYLIELEPGKLPQVKGADDAAKAKWVPLSEFEKMEDQMFEDHYHIISYFLRGV